MKCYFYLQTLKRSPSLSPARLLSFYGASRFPMCYPFLNSRVPSPMEICSLSWAKDYSSGSIQKYLQGRVSRPHETFSILIPTLFLLPGCTFTGTWEAVDGRYHRWGSLAGLHAKASYRMDGVRSLCNFRIFSSKISRPSDTGECDSQQWCSLEMSRF